MNIKIRKYSAFLNSTFTITFQSDNFSDCRNKIIIYKATEHLITFVKCFLSEKDYEYYGDTILIRKNNSINIIVE
jgi:hypothetical protein